MPADVACDLAAASRVPDVNSIAQIKGVGEIGQIIGISVEIIACPRLAGAPMTATVVSDDAVTVFMAGSFVAGWRFTGTVFED
jgi:hypothetical protein